MKKRLFKILEKEILDDELLISIIGGVAALMLILALLMGAYLYVYFMGLDYYSRIYGI